MRYVTLLLCLFSLGAQAQNGGHPQWFRNPEPIPKQFPTQLRPDIFTTHGRLTPAEPLPFDTAGVVPSVVVTGAVVDEYLRPLAGVTVNDATTDAEGRFYLTAARADRLTLRAEKQSFYGHTVGFAPTVGDTQFVMIHLAKKVVTHKLPATTGGKISQDGFWLTLPANGVKTADGNLYTGEVHLSVLARRPGDRDFGQRMPGGDFMAEDAAGASKILYSYGFTGVELATSGGAPLQLTQPATIEFLITEEQRPGAPDEMPLWHFDETKGLWVEAGVVRKEGLTYRAQVDHFSWWNCDRPYPPACIEGWVIDCWGKPVMGAPVTVNQRGDYTDNEGRFKGTVPATIDLDLLVIDHDTTLAAFAPDETRSVGTFDAGWGRFEAVGMVDTNDLLTVYSYGATEGVEYSIDGDNWQAEPEFPLDGGGALPPQGWARVVGCSIIRFGCYPLVKHKDCRIYELNDLYSMRQFTSLDELYSEDEVAYLAIISNPNLKLLKKVSSMQRCVQGLGLRDADNIQPDDMEQIFGAWPNLLTIFFDNCQINEIPESINGLESLNELAILDGQISNLPTCIGNLTNLMTITISNNRLTSLPESLGNLTNLTELELPQNGLTSLPQTLGNLRALQHLYLDDNKLTSLPESLGNLSRLVSLHIQTNQLTSLPESLGNLRTLQNLYLSENQLTTLPESFGDLYGLRSLQLGGNQLTSVPAALGHLVGLYEISLVDNQLTNLPESLGNLGALKSLNLGRNQLTSLPASLGNLRVLSELFLYNNQMTTLPAIFANLANTLKTLNLKGNPISPEEQARIRAMLPNTNITF